MTEDLYKELSERELEKLEEVKTFKIDNESFKVVEGFCPVCNKKMNKLIENKSLFDGTLTFHIIKFRCDKCDKEFLDLEQAKSYDLFLLLRNIAKKPLSVLNETINKLKLKT